MLYIYNIMSNIQIIQEDSVKVGQLLENCAASFEQRFGVTLTFHDQQGIFHLPDGSGCLFSRQTHCNAYCMLRRYAAPENNRRCLHDCAAMVEHQSQKSAAPFLHDCWKGAREVVLPYYRGPRLLFLVYAGVFRGGEPPEEFRAAWKELPPWRETLLEPLLAELRVLNAGIAALLEPGTEMEPPPDRRELIRRYLFVNAHRKLTLSDLGRHLSVSPSRASHLCRTCLGVSFQESLLAIRMRKAAELLTGSSLPLKEIARQCGFANVFYFSAAFRKFHDVPPGAFRRRTNSARRGDHCAE